MKTKLHLFFMLLLFYSFMPNALATNYYTTSANATIAGAASAYWTTNPDGATGLGGVTIVTGDNLFILNGGVVTVNTSMTLGNLTVNSGGKLITNYTSGNLIFNDVTLNQGGIIDHSINTATNVTINGTFIWNGSVKSSGYFFVNGNVIGATATHDVNSARSIVLGGTGKTISLIELSDSYKLNALGLSLNTSRALVGDCKIYTQISYGGNATLDLAGFNLQVAGIKNGAASTKVIKGHPNSTLTISGLTSATSSTIYSDVSPLVLKGLVVNAEYASNATANVVVGGDLTVNSLTFGTPSGDINTRNLQVNGNFSLTDNGTMRVQSKGTTASTLYDQLSATGTITIGSGTTLKVDYVNSYFPAVGSQFDFATSTGLTGTFQNLQLPGSHLGNLTYPSNKVTLTTAGTQSPTYYTTSANATIAGNGAVSANWTTNPDGVTGLGSATIVTGDNLVILDGGLVKVNTTMTLGNLTVKSGGKLIPNYSSGNLVFNDVTLNQGGIIDHSFNTGTSMTINGTLTWNGSIKSSGYFFVNGNVIGATAIHDINSARGIILGGTGKTISLIESSDSYKLNASGLSLNTSRALVGDCKIYTQISYGGNATLDLAGFNLQVAGIKNGVAGTKVIKGNPNSTLTISGLTSATSSTVYSDVNPLVLKGLVVNSEYASNATANVAVGADLTVNSLTFGTPSGDINTRNLQVTGNFSLTDNGTMRVQSKGTIPSTKYDQLSVTGNITLGTGTSLKVDLTNGFTFVVGSTFDFAKSTGGTISGSFTTVQDPTNYSSNLTYPSGNTVRYESISGPPPTPACSMPSMNPDIPLEASTPAVEAEIETIINRYLDTYLGTVAPTAAQLAAAVDSYNQLGITVNGYAISGSGTPIVKYNQVDFLKVFIQQLKFNPNDTDTYTKALNTVWLVSERVCNGSLNDGDVYAYRSFVGNGVLIPRIKDNSYVRAFFENVMYKSAVFDYLWDPTYQYGISMDVVANTSNATLCYVKWIDSADERYRYMKGFKRYMERFMMYTPGTADGIKPDGSGFHHWASYPGYMYDYNAPANIVYYLRETSFQVSKEAYLRYRDGIMAQTMFANDKGIMPLSMSGRMVGPGLALSLYHFRSLALAGGSIMGTGASDPVLATYYNRVWGNYGPFGNNTIAPFNEGYFQFNHSMAGFYRKDGWVASFKGFSDNMFGAESYAGVNRFGRYQSYGTVEIIYPGDRIGNGADYSNWNWNYNPGTTVIRLPWDKLIAERDRLDEHQQKRFVGSLSFINKGGDYLEKIKGTYGMFAMDFQEKTGQGSGPTYAPESHNATFVFKKSVFTFDNMLICLGSGIGNNDAVNTTLTTLFQRKTSAGKDLVNVDNNTLQAVSYDNNYSGNGNHWIVDNYGTGFYVFAGSGDVKLTRADQQTPQHTQMDPNAISTNPVGNYAIGYIDHGTAPSNKGYEYVCMPKSTTADMATLGSQIDAGNKPYTVHRKDEIAHIVEYKPTATSNSIFGYAFFSPLSGINNPGGLVTGTDYPCLAMAQYDPAQRNLKIAVNNPDLGFTYRAYTPSVTRLVNIKIKGTNWQISQPNANASITGTANGETTIQFTTVDGLPVEIVLSRVLTSQTVAFEALPAKVATDAAFDLTATASSNLPVSYTSSNTDVATVSGSTVTIVGKGTSTITAKQDGDDIYAAATAVEQTLTVNPAAQTITFDAIPTKGISDTAFDLAATASSNLPVSYTSSNTDVATISGSTVTIVGKGNTTITASQEGNNIYDVATAVEQILRVNTEATVSITSPLANASYNAPATITITADASDVDGSVSKVEFFQGETKLGEATTAPYTLDWNDVAAGSYALTAKATDNDGAITTSDIVNVIVNALPSVSITSPSANGNYNAPATITISADASDADGSVSKVEFFQGTNKLGESTTAPYSFDWNNVEAGSYTLTAKATDNDGALTTSESVSFTVNALPTVAVTSPANNASFESFATIAVNATATDADGSVSKVEFFNGSAKLGEVTQAPYSYNWNNVPAGSYALTAKTIDNNGAVTTSAVVTVNVVCPTLQLSIPDVYAMNPSIDDKNTIYLGYGPTSLTLNSLVQGNQDVTYTWNTGAHTPSISVSQAGTYTVTATYAGGCQSTASIEINVLDVRCGNDNTKVQICHNNNVICVAQSAVQSHLNHGDKLGSCNGTSKMTVKEEVTTSANFTVYPNPVQDSFNVSVSSKLDPNATIGIYNILGNKIRQVRFTTVPQNVFVGDLPSGNYIVVVQNGVETFRSTIVKQ